MMNQKEKEKRTNVRKGSAVKDSTSIRFSENEKKIITEKAVEKGKHFSEYVRDCALHGDQALTPYQKAKIQNVINTAVDTIMETDPEKAETMRKEMLDVWTM